MSYSTDSSKCKYFITFRDASKYTAYYNIAQNEDRQALRDQQYDSDDVEKFLKAIRLKIILMLIFC